MRTFNGTISPRTFIENLFDTLNQRYAVEGNRLDEKRFRKNLKERGLSKNEIEASVVQQRPCRGLS